MRKIIYRPDSITESDDIIKLGESDFIIPGREVIEDGPFLLGDLDEPPAGDGGDDPAAEDDGPGSAPRARPAPARSRRGEAELEEVREMGRLIIEQATAEASRIIEAGHLKVQSEYASVMDEARAQIASDREEARRQGRSEALKLHTDRITGCIKDLEEAVCRIESAQAAFITGYENDLKWMALKIAEQILSDVIDADETRLLSLVMAAVRSAKSDQWLTVEISDEMTGLLTALRQELEAQGLEDAVSIKITPSPSDTCIIETTDKFLDASVHRQIENLRDYFAAEIR